MTPRTYAWIVCSPQPRVGTTTAARLLADWFAFNDRPFVGYDTDPHVTPLHLWFPRQVSVADMGAIQGQIALFDGLLVADATPKIVDVWSRAYRPFFDLAASIGFFEEAEQRGVTPFIVYCADGTQANLRGARDLAERWPQVEMIVVNDEGAAPLGPHALDVLAAYPAARSFRFAELDLVVRRTIEDEAFSFSAFMREEPHDMSIVVRAALRAWITRAFQQFQAMEVRLAFSDSEWLR